MEDIEEGMMVVLGLFLSEKIRKKKKREESGQNPRQLMVTHNG